MRHKATAGYIESKDIEEFEALMAPWDLELDQLSPGPFHCRVEFTKLPGITVYEAHWDKAARTRGSSPNGLVVFAVNLNWREACNYWCGHVADRRHFACAGPNMEFGHTSPDQSHHAVLLVAQDLLATTIGKDAFELVCRSNSLQFSDVDGERLISAMTGVVRMSNADPNFLRDTHQIEDARSWLLGSLCHCINYKEVGEQSEPPSLREAAVHWAIEYIDQTSEPITAMALASTIGVSQRTLEHGFRDTLGMTPAEYIRYHRMNRVYHILSKAQPSSTTISQTASQYCFSNHGRFSVKYREHFGEKPSSALRRIVCGSRYRFFESVQ
jgi:AraC-like DNA-binding protein